MGYQTKEKKAEYYKNNREKILETRRAYYLKNKRHMLDNHKVWASNNREKMVAYYKKYRENHLDYAKDYLLKKNYGISLHEYNELLSKQNGVCAICFKPPVKKSLHVDHCHKTNIIRGLLCPNCNRAIGNMFDSEVLLKSAIKYLKK